MAFDIKDLELRNDSREEQVRTRVIFEDLKAKAISGALMTEHEKNFFCEMVKISLLNDGAVTDYSCCENYQFKWLYLVYHFDLTGGSRYERPQRTITDRGTIEVSVKEIPRHEVQEDLNLLHQQADQWRLIIRIENHSNSLLQEVSKEARIELKNLNNQALTGFRYIYAERALLLQFKYLHCILLEIKETMQPEDWLMNLNGQEIEITDYSMVHIFNRHFGAVLKQYETGKSYHGIQIDYRTLNLQLKEILKRIDESGLLRNSTLEKITFRLHSSEYVVWVKERWKQVQGAGNVKFLRLEIFYPLTDINERKGLYSSHNFQSVDQDLGVFYPKVSMYSLMG